MLLGGRAKEVMEGQLGRQGKIPEEKAYFNNYFLFIFLKVPFNQLLKQRQKLKTFHINKQQRAPNA